MRQEGRGCAGKSSNLVSQRDVMADLPGQHVEHLATLARPHATSPPSASSFSRSDPSEVKDGRKVARRPGAQRMVMYASHLRVESSLRHTQSVAASQAIRAAALPSSTERRSSNTQETVRSHRRRHRWDLRRAKAGREHSSAHASRLAGGPRSRRDSVSKCSEISSSCR